MAYFLKKYISNSRGQPWAGHFAAMTERKSQLTEIRLIERTASAAPTFSPDNKPLDRAGFSGRFQKNEDVASWIEKSMRSRPICGYKVGMWPEKVGNVAMVIFPIAWQLAFAFGAEKYARDRKAWHVGLLPVAKRMDECHGLDDRNLYRRACTHALGMRNTPSESGHHEYRHAYARALGTPSAMPIWIVLPFAGTQRSMAATGG